VTKPESRPSSAAIGPPIPRALALGCETFVIDFVTTVRVVFEAALATPKLPAVSATVVNTTVAIFLFDIYCPFVP
jgi:hypothetical protein